MRLIDLDKTMKNLAKANMSRTGDEFERFLLSQPTVEAIPLSVIDDIKAEIEKIRSDNYMDYLIRHVCNKILKIIDEKSKGV